MENIAATTGGEIDCRTCGACCSYSSEWPRFTLETEVAISRIPQSLLNRDGSGMKCTGNRCAALLGAVGSEVSCSIYGARPDVCHSCSPGDEACQIACRHFGLAVHQSGT